LKPSVVILVDLSSYNLFDQWTYTSPQDESFHINSFRIKVVFSNGCKIYLSGELLFSCPDGTKIDKNGKIIVDSEIKETTYLVLDDGTIIDLVEFTINF
jgi:hypothetical protein